MSDHTNQKPRKPAPAGFRRFNTGPPPAPRPAPPPAPPPPPKWSIQRQHGQGGGHE